MDLSFTAEQEAFRDEARAWLEAHVPAEPLPSMDTAEGFAQHRRWEATLDEGRWSAVWWPEQYGGRGVDLMHWLIFEEEYWRSGAPLRVNQNGIFLLGPTLLGAGTDEQKARFLPRLAAGRDIWCQGWSEPNAGSDLAAIQSRARLSDDGSEWIVSGQKTWCSRAVWADWIFGIFRTDPAAERHRGLTYIMLPLDSPGVTVRPIAKFDGEPGFAEVFFDDVHVSVDNTLGEVGRGWQVAMATAGFERGVLLRSPARYVEAVRRLGVLYESSASCDATVRDAVAGAWMDADAYRLHTYMTVSRLLDGEPLGPEVSLNKIFWSEMDVRIHETALRLLGDQAMLDGRWLHGWMASLAGPIFAGTNEIQRNIVADRVLQLPRGA
ncbi:MAG TPA: acyl-CoA dehydrogenase family protein [Candidatus Dormibacteraeota bacterium]|jgi:alkylation response protein AidB-like acyl-CoA dehydrogenase|nr:acyl-CoA dehydrogenase family protein [Candidatus Dormibacteraeota bacterium]